MKGKHRVILQNNRLHYEFEIRRNITIIQGDSATGKTTLINLLRQYENLGDASGIDVVCDVPCRVLEGREWRLLLGGIAGSILFIDEENAFIHTEEFAAAIRETDNYYVLITRENLYNLPYSVEEIYGLRAAGKYQNTKRVYQQTYQIYSHLEMLPVVPDVIVTEDSNSGYEFFHAVGAAHGMDCISAGGKSNLYRTLSGIEAKTICVIADGAAIGPEMNRLYEQAVRKDNVALYLPESFEWLVLQSGLIDGKELLSILDAPESHIESREFFSWERYFASLLSEQTQGSYLQYSKNHLNPVYLHGKNRGRILQCIKGIRFE